MPLFPRRAITGLALVAAEPNPTTIHHARATGTEPTVIEFAALLTTGEEISITVTR